MGNSRGTRFTLKDAINKDIVPGPRIYTADNIVTRSGGHGTATMLNETFAHAAHDSLSCDGVESCRKAVREQIGRGADLIKTTASGSARDEWSTETAPPTFFDDELKALMDTPNSPRLRRLNPPQFLPTYGIHDPAFAAEMTHVVSTNF